MTTVFLQGETADECQDLLHFTVAPGFRGINPSALPGFLPDLAGLTPPAFNGLLFWDDGTGELRWLAPGDHLAVDGDLLDVVFPPLVESLAGLSDPGADAILWWDDGLGELDWLAIGAGLSIVSGVLGAPGTSNTFTARSPASGAGNPLTLVGSNAVSGNTNGGNVVLTPGVKSGTGKDGNVVLTRGRLDLSALPDGSKIAPLISMPSVSGSAGWYIVAVDQIGLAINSVVIYALAQTQTVYADGYRLNWSSGSPDAAGADVGITRFGVGKLVLTNAAAGAGTLVLRDGGNVETGTTTGSIISVSPSQRLGFWGVTPVVQQVLATGAGHTVDDVIALLQTLGLCRQS
jgi:hypothetical protein